MQAFATPTLTNGRKPSSIWRNTTRPTTVVSPTAVAALGDADAISGKLDDAVSKFKKAAKMADKQSADDVNFSFSPTYLHSRCMMLESQGKRTRL